MARYIDADALTEHIQKFTVVTDNWFGMGIARGIERAETAIQMQPTADVVPKSEVAREIFEEISKASVEWGCYCITASKSGFLTDDVNKTLAELKKKYTEEQ